MIELLHGDCLEIMPTLPDESVDMILCDLPYGTTACKWDVIIPFELLWKQYNRLIKDSGAVVLFGIEPFSSLLRISNLSKFKYDWYLKKEQADGFLNSKKQPLREYEIASVFNSKRYNPQLLQTKRFKTKVNATGKQSGIHGAVIDELQYAIRDFKYPRNTINFEKVVNAVHPTQKPVALMKYLIKTYTNEGETVLDNCMGSGTTGVACKDLNRNFIGIEKDPKYFKIAEKRINKTKIPLLFE